MTGLDELAGLVRGHTRSVCVSRQGLVSARTLSRIAHVFGCSLGWLYQGDGAPPSDEEIRAAVARAERRARARTGTSG
jgi:hypothetical protein